MHKLNASSRIMFEEAQKMGISCTPFDDSETILMEYQGKQWYVRGSRTSFQSSVGKTIADYKPLTKQVLTHFKLPTAQFAEVSTEQDLEKLSALAYPLVMKPVSERHGTGVVVGLQDFQAAKQVFMAYNKPVLFEEKLEGTEYRVVCIDYKFTAAAFRKPAFVTGDGTHTIEALLAEKNKHPWRGAGHENNLSLIIVDDQVVSYLSEQNLTLQSIPEKEREVFLRKTANLSTGGEAWDVTAKVCPENAALFEKIARVCDLNIVGIDIMCQSLETPILNQPKAGVIEVNASPGLRMHHYPMQGEPKNIAGKIITLCQEKIKVC